MHPSRNSIGEYIKTLACGAFTALAAGTGDNTAVEGATIDRLGYGSVRLVIAYLTSLTAAQTLSFAVEYQESANGSDWDTATALQGSTVAETGAQTNGVDEITFDLDLSGKKRYIRFNFTPNLSHSGTDTATGAAVAVLGGADAVPAV